MISNANDLPDILAIKQTVKLPLQTPLYKVNSGVIPMEKRKYAKRNSQKIILTVLIIFNM